MMKFILSIIIGAISGLVMYIFIVEEIINKWIKNRYMNIFILFLILFSGCRFSVNTQRCYIQKNIGFSIDTKIISINIGYLKCYEQGEVSRVAKSVENIIRDIGGNKNGGKN